ncbi:MAG: hypothetical protein IJJ94_00330 [Bacteroidaceae bacterium]|nr:hypothetical protein [Bacteroidaceae bacterium]
MFKVLFRLWLSQKRRSFSWRTFIAGAILTLYFIVLVVAVFFGLREQLAAATIPFELAAIVPALAVSLGISDLIIKLLWRRSPVEMDDYLRTRPIGQRMWARFILFDTCMGFLQWILPCGIAFIAALFMPLWTAPLVLLLAYSISVVNAVFQNCWRRAPGNEWTLPLVPAYMLWLVLTWAVAIGCFVVVGLAGDDPSTPVQQSSVVWSVLLFSALLLLVNGLAVYALQSYFCRLRNHNEEEHAPVVVSARQLGEVSVWSIEWTQIMRSKRLRMGVIAMAVLFLLNTYMQQSSTIQNDFGGVNIMLLFGIAFPSIIVAQWVLGVEANYFSGVWTKPWSVEGILRRKFIFLCGMCVVMALLILPCVVFMGMNFWTWLATLLFGCGVFVLPFMATCLYSSRMDMFSSAFFNYQGGNKQLNFFSFIMFVPMAIYFASYFLLPQPWSHVVVGGLGLVALLLHRRYIHWVASLWFRRRYEIMERWLSE